MIAFVVILNTLLALVNFYIAWRVWKMRRILAGVTKAILTADCNTYNTLHPAPSAIAIGKKGTSALRQQYGKLTIQLEQLGQILALIRVGLRIVGLSWKQLDRGTVRSRSRSGADALNGASARSRQRQGGISRRLIR